MANTKFYRPKYIGTTKINRRRCLNIFVGKIVSIRSGTYPRITTKDVEKGIYKKLTTNYESVTAFSGLLLLSIRAGMSGIVQVDKGVFIEIYAGDIILIKG